MAATLMGQTVTSSVSGYVWDSSRALMMGAVVEARAEATGRSVEARTDAAGFYRLPALEPGDYVLTASYTGFSPHKQRLTLTVDARLRLDFTLAPVQRQVRNARTCR